jgi:hypothetical protein
MKGLLEWNCGGGGLQLFEKPEDAGRGTLTLFVEDIRAERDRLADTGLVTGEIETADYTSILRLRSGRQSGGSGPAQRLSRIGCISP